MPLSSLIRLSTHISHSIIINSMKKLKMSCGGGATIGTAMTVIKTTTERKYHHNTKN